MSLKLIVDIDRLKLHVREAIEAFGGDNPPDNVAFFINNVVQRVTEDPHHVEALSPPHDHPDCTQCHGFGAVPDRLESGLPAGQDWSASAFGLGLPGAKPTGRPSVQKIPPAVHPGRRSEVVEDEVAWCTEMVSDHTTRILNLVTCNQCGALWNAHMLALAESVPVITREELNAALEEQLTEDMESDRRECLDERMEGM